MTERQTFKSAGLRGAYDLIFPLGASEQCSYALRLYGLQHEPFFFDNVSEMSLLERVRLIVGFPDETEPRDEISSRQIGCLVSRLESSGSVLAAYVVPPDEEAPSDDELEKALLELRRRFPNVVIELVLVMSRRGYIEDKWRSVSPGIAVVTADYHPRSATAGGFSFGCDPRALTAVFTGMRMNVSMALQGGMEAEAWGKSESGGWHRKGNLRLFSNIRLLRFKMGRHAGPVIPLHAREERVGSLRIGRTVWVVVRQRGALDFSQLPRPRDGNALVRLRLALVRILQVPQLFVHSLFTKRREFSHFLLLGYNCELAYRFIMANGFLDSTFFAWTGVWRFWILLEALRRFDELFVGELVFSGGGDLLVDVPTGISMHAKPRAEKEGLGAADVEAVKTELRSRAAYLREKFYRQLRDDEPTLAVVKLSTCDCPKGDENARDLVEQLKSMGGRNFHLLVICQKADARFFPKDHPDYDLRTVAAFNPDWLVASERVGDRLGWMRLWREFAPVRKKVENKTYKFQGKGRA